MVRVDNRAKKMTKIITIMVLFLLLVINAFADGFVPMELKQVLLETDTIILVEIIENKQTIKHENKGKGNLEESVTYTNHIKSKVLSSHVGESPGKEYSTKYSLVLVKGVWLEIPGSGLEGSMKPGEKYVFLLKKNEGKYSLLRAEKAESLEIVLRLKMDQTEEPLLRRR
jgi:hypothetical protein